MSAIEQKRLPIVLTQYSPLASVPRAHGFFVLSNHNNAIAIVAVADGEYFGVMFVMCLGEYKRVGGSLALS